MGFSLRHVVVAARDGAPLEGLLTLPDAPRRTALFITHGVGGSYESGVPAWFGREAGPHGYAVLALNRRDWGANNARSSFEDGLDDLAVGIELLARQGFSRVVLCGHSKGTLYPHQYVAEREDRRVVGIALYGAVHDNALAAGEGFMLGRLAGNVRAAQRACAEGRGREVMSFATLFPTGTELTAEGFLSYFGPLSLARPVEAIRHTRLPTLSCWCVGDVMTPERYHLAICAAGREAGVPVQHVVVGEGAEPEGGHDFVGVESEAMARTVAWLDEHALT